MSSLEDGQEPVSQAGLFRNLTAGGPLPKLPLELHTMLPTPRQGELAWTGRHLAFTQRNGRYYEWTLYVPNQTVPRVGIPGYDFEYRVHPAGPDDSQPEMTPRWGAGNPLRIRNAGDFDEFLIGAMAELSDDGVAPEYVTYDYVMQLCEEIRASLDEF
jgi:hypothetical protein